MIPLPKWIKEIFDKGSCPHCKKNLQKKGVFGVGIREEKVKKKKSYSFCYEYTCPSCSERTVFTGFPVTFEDFIGDLIDISEIFPETSGKMEELTEADYEGMEEGFGDDTEEPTAIPPKKKPTGMTDKEAKEGMKLIQETKYYEDLLDKLGIKKLDRESREDESK
jgi:hypothetical protein